MFRKTMKKVRKYRDIKFNTNYAKMNNLLSEPRYQTEIFVINIYQRQKRKKTPQFINKPVYVGLPLLETSKIVTYKFLYDYVKQKYGGKAKLRCMDADSFIPAGTRRSGHLLKVA